VCVLVCVCQHVGGGDPGANCSGNWPGN